jgi:hypothetical protein
MAQRFGRSDWIAGRLSRSCQYGLALHLATFSEATDMSPSAKLPVLLTKERDFAIVETGLNRDEQKEE